MNITDKARTITAVRATGPSSLHLSWSEGTAADLDLGAVLADRAFAALRDPGEFAKVEVGDWGHRLAWPTGAELGAAIDRKSVVSGKSGSGGVDLGGAR